METFRTVADLATAVPSAVAPSLTEPSHTQPSHTEPRPAALAFPELCPRLIKMLSQLRLVTTLDAEFHHYVQSAEYQKSNRTWDRLHPQRWLLRSFQHDVRRCRCLPCLFVSRLVDDHSYIWPDAVSLVALLHLDAA